MTARLLTGPPRFAQTSHYSRAAKPRIVAPGRVTTAWRYPGVAKW
jgi:hypothetical protein